MDCMQIVPGMLKSGGGEETAMPLYHSGGVHQHRPVRCVVGTFAVNSLFIVSAFVCLALALRSPSRKCSCTMERSILACAIFSDFLGDADGNSNVIL